MDNKARLKREAGEMWWQDWRWIAAVSGFVFSLGFCAFVYITVGNSEVLERLDGIAQSNAEEIKKIEANQQGIDSLVAFVEEIRQEEGNGGGGQSEAVRIIIETLCASSDPVRIEACQRLQGEGDPP